MVNKLCEDCASWKMVGEKCWFYWENKKMCTNHRKSETAEPSYKEVEFCE